MKTDKYCLDKFLGVCFFYSNELMNWFDGSDFCKTRGAEIGKFNTKSEEDVYRVRFGVSPFSTWIGYHGHEYKGKKFVWSDGSKSVYNRLLEKTLKEGLSTGLCTLLQNSNLTSWKRGNCSEKHRVLCTQPGKFITSTII